MSAKEAWSEHRIGELLQESRTKGGNGRAAKKLTIRLYGRGIIASVDRGGSESTVYYRRKAGQFAYSKLDCLNGAFGIIPPELDGYESTLDLPAFDFVSAIEPKWFLKTVARPTFYGRFKFAAIGSRKANRVPTEEFLATRLSVPPVAEQRAIAESLDAFEQAIVKSQALVETIERSRTEIVYDFQGAENSGKWPIRAIGALLDKCQYGLSIPLDGEGSVPVLRMPDIDAGRINEDETTLKFADVTPADIASCSVRKGDILFNRTNSQALVGKTGVVRNTPHLPIVFASYIIRLVVKPSVDPFWLNAVFNLPRTQERLKALATPGVSQWNINSKILKRFKIPVPPKAEQARFAELYEAIERRLEAERATLKRLEEAHAVFAQELLSGRLRLPESIISRHCDKPGQAA